MSLLNYRFNHVWCLIAASMPISTDTFVHLRSGYHQASLATGRPGDRVNVGKQGRQRPPVCSFAFDGCGDGSTTDCTHQGRDAAPIKTRTSSKPKSSIAG